MNIYEKKLRWKYILFLAAVLIGLGSLFYTNRLVKVIAEEEHRKMELWARATGLLANAELSEQEIDFPLSVLQNNIHIPVILTNAEGEIIDKRNLDTTRINEEAYLQKALLKMKAENDSIVVDLGNNNYQYLYYRNSNILRKLAAFPYLQLAVIILFISVSYIAFSISRRAEQNKVWNGLSKETAHQLGTPISSLAGWVEILKQSDADPSTTIELEKDIKRLERIAERFSKIGSKPSLVPSDIVELIENSISYLKTRRGKSVKFNLDLPANPVYVPLNVTLFDWVIENLCKNAIDAMEGSGTISIRCIPHPNTVIIDISDTGKGIPKSAFKNVFKPGYTTKKRGWGLGLSLTKRIIESYHDGKVYVHSSEPGVKTVFRMVLHR